MKKNLRCGSLKAVCWLVSLMVATACQHQDANQGKGNAMPMEHNHHAMAPGDEMPMNPAPPDSGNQRIQSYSVDNPDLDMLVKPTYEYVLSSVKTINPVRKNLPQVVDAPGYLTYDMRRTASIAARFAGRIERMYVKYLYQPVAKGERIMDVYSPEIVTAQQDLIFLLKHNNGDTTLLRNARSRLSLLGLTSGQIDEVEKYKKAMLSLPVFSPVDGLVFEQPVPAPAVQMEGTMPEGNRSRTASPVSGRPESGTLALREGMYFAKGQRLFSLQSLSTVWAMLEIYSPDVQAVKIGQPVSLQIEPFEKPITGKIDYLEPQFGTPNKNVRARVYLENPGGKFKPGSLLSSRINTGNSSGRWIPRTAALDLGRRIVVFIKQQGVFKSRTIEAGSISGSWLEVLSGVSDADEVAVDARFLMDSESFIKPNQ